MSGQTTGTDRGRIWKWLLIAAAAALALLFFVVLPAEYGYDPTRVGRMLGLTAMNERRGGGDQSLDEVIDDLLSANENLAAPVGGDPLQPIPLPNPGVSQLEESPPRSETLRIRLGFDEKTEVKAVRARNKALVYSWKVEGGEVYVDFHGHDPARGDDFWVRYEEAGQEQGVTARNGSLVAPFAGEHGWFWLNVSEEPITIELTVTGYFEKLMDYGLLQ